MKTFLLYFFLAVTCCVVFSRCCGGGGDDGDIGTVLDFRVQDSESDRYYFAFGGVFYAEPFSIFLDDNATLASFQEPLDDGYIVLDLDENYGARNGDETYRKYFLHLPESDIDTLEVFHIRDTDRCGNDFERFDRCIFNNTTYTTQLDFLK